MTIHHFCAQGIPTVIIMAEYFKTLGPSKCNTIYTMVSWLWALVDLVDLWQLPKVFPSAYKIINGKNGEIPFNKFLNSYELIGSLILDDFGVFILECHNPPTDFTCFTGKPLSGGHLHGADRQLHVAGGISAFGSTGKGLSLCDLRWIYGWHWSRRDAQRPKKLYPSHFTRRR